MYAMLLNPPRRRRKKSRRRLKLSKSCRRHIARVAARRGRKTRVLKKKRSARAARRMAKKVAAQEKRDPWDILPTRYRAANSRRRRRGRRRARNYSHWIPAYAENPRRKRSRRRNGRRRSRNYSHWIPAYAENPSWVPSYAMNPGLSGITGMLTKAFSTKKLKEAGSVVLGAAVNTTVDTFVSPYLPSLLQKGLGGVAFNLASAGLLGAVAGKVSPKFAGPVFFGGVFTAVHKIAKEYVLPALGLSGCCGIGDYAESMITTPFMPSYSESVGLNTMYPTDYAFSPMTPQEFGMGDYLTRLDAAGASPLGGHSIDGVATAELSS